jgi:hypothetical protein
MVYASHSFNHFLLLSHTLEQAILLNLNLTLNAFYSHSLSFSTAHSSLAENIFQHKMFYTKAYRHKLYSLAKILRSFGGQLHCLAQWIGGPSKCFTKLMVIGLWSMGLVPKIFGLCLGQSSLFFSFEVPSFSFFFFCFPLGCEWK